MSKDRLTQTWVYVDGQRTRLRSVPAVLGTEGISVLPLLLLHGLGCSSDAWLPSLRCLSARAVPLAAFAPDFPGCGRSDAAGGAMGMDDLGDWTAQLLDSLEIEQAHIAGNSMGCQVALALARRHPSRVASVALLGPTTGSANVPFWRYALGLLWDAFGESLHYNLVLLRMYTEMGLGRYFATVRKMMEDDPLVQASDVQAPVIVMRGGHDRIVTEEMAQKLAAALPDAQYQPLDSTAHAAEFNTPDLFVSAVLEFLERVQQGKPLPQH